MTNIDEDDSLIDYCVNMGESSKFPKSWTFETPFLKFAVYLLIMHNFKFKWSNVLIQTENKPEKQLWFP